MGRRATGTYERTQVGGEEIAAFVPLPLPPADPPIELQGPLLERLRAAERALERLESVGAFLPEWMVSLFARKEAVVSCQIEGTQASLANYLAFEAGAHDETPGIEEIRGYLEALDHARAEIASPVGLPLSMRLLNQAHILLMRGPRAEEKEPGEIRRSQNWIGGTRPGNAVFVPPPPQHLPELLSAFEKYIHADDGIPPLVRAGLLHVQFETIHPYLDGNGRIGRLLITLLLEHGGLLSRPLLFLSLYFKWHRFEYYERLGAIRSKGDWEGWLDYFLEGVRSIADRVLESARTLGGRVTNDRARLLEHPEASLDALRLFESLPRHPIVSLDHARRRLGGDEPNASRAIDSLVRTGILAAEKDGRSWTYQAFLEELRVGTDLPPVLW